MADDPGAERVVRRLTAGLTVLGSLDVAAGSVLAVAGRNPAARAFGQQTAAWGAADLAIAGFSSRRPPPSGRRLRAVLLLNAGLDVAYVAVGALVASRRPALGRTTPQAVRGHGLAVAFQGLALLVLDLVHASVLTSEVDGTDEPISDVRRS